MIAVAIVVLGLCLKSGFGNIAQNKRVVTVRGLCEKEFKANKVTWPIVTKQMGNDLPSIYTQTEKDIEAIKQYLFSNGITEEEISLNAPQVYDLNANRYSDQNYKYRYQVVNVLVVTSDKVDKVRELIQGQSELLKKNIAIVAGDYEYQTTFEYTDLNAIKPEMIAEATQNARAAADRFAADSHSTIGKIQDATQGQFSINDRDQYTPYIKTIRVVTSITYFLED